jgi:hypothetical protein
MVSGNQNIYRLLANMSKADYADILEKDKPQYQIIATTVFDSK